MIDAGEADEMQQMFDDDFAVGLGTVLAANPPERLRTVRIQSGRITDIGALALSCMLAATRPSLEVLNRSLDGNPITDALLLEQAVARRET